MITNVVVEVPSGGAWQELVLPMFTPNNHGLFIHKITGLEPVDFNVITKSYGQVDGEFLGGMNRGKRNLVLFLGMESRGYDVEQARRQLYAYFQTKNAIVLRFEFDNREAVRIATFIESFDGDRFVNDLEMQISLIAPKPNFWGVTERVITGDTEYLDDPTIITNAGDQSVGAQILMPNDASINADIYIQTAVGGNNQVTFFANREMRLYTWLAGWEDLWVDSHQGQKAVEAVADNDRRTLLGAMTAGSVWPLLHPGDNLFRIRVSGDNGEIVRNWTLKYFEQYGGI